MDILIATYIFLLGLCFGSFALAVADREKSKRDWVKGRSLCESCKHTLGVRDLIPVVSWTLTRGKCRYCKVSLSKLYPVTELMAGIAFVLSYLIAFDASTISALILFAMWLIGLVLMMILFIIDARSYFLPYKFLFPLVAIAGIHASVSIITSDGAMTQNFLVMLGSVAVGGGIFFILHVISSGSWIGDGDVFLGLAIGLFLGSPFVTWFALIVASLLGLSYALLVRVKSKKSLRRAKIPFGPFLISGLFIAYLFGQQVIDWYARTILFL